MIKETIDFYKALNSLVNENNTDNENICLISNEPLLKNHITLECSHSFNYVDIFQEIKNQKKNHNYKEITLLKFNQIKCPYCRHVQNGLLPFLKQFQCAKIRGVNSPDKFVYKPNKCSYIFISGKKKNLCCQKSCYYKHCILQSTLLLIIHY